MLRKTTLVLLCAATLAAGTELQPATTPQQRRPLTDFKNSEFLLRHHELPDRVLPDLQELAANQNLFKIGAEDGENLARFLALYEAVRADAVGVELRKDVPYTLVIPKLPAELVKSLDRTAKAELFREHIVPAVSKRVFEEPSALYGNLNENAVEVKRVEHGKVPMWTLNDARVLRMDQVDPLLAVVYIDGALGDRRGGFSKRNIQETTGNRYNEPQRLEMKNATAKETPVGQKEPKTGALMQFLAGMKSGTKVFQHFLSKSNVTQMLDDGHFVVLIPSDSAFQRWHPIDWGFYPFSVPEFTESVLRNHFLPMKSPLRMVDVKNMDKEQKFKTLGGDLVIFKGHPQPMVNNVSILNDFTLPNGNQVFIISEVLFVSEAVVSRLHQMHKDKETPPLLAFPWFGAQFLSHAFLALERDSRFSQITRFLNTAEIAPFVSGSNYTFFVPVDEAFERLGFDILPDDVLASEKGVKMLLNHFIKGRLYDRDLRHEEVFETIGGGTVRIHRPHPGNNVTVNNARIIETEIFVYNLGTMFYIDSVLYAHLLKPPTTSSPAAASSDPEDELYTTEMPLQDEVYDKQRPTAASSTPTVSSSSPTTPSSSSSSFFYSTKPDVEIVPSEFTEPSGRDEDFLLAQDDEIVTPRVLPVKFQYDSPKK